MDLNTQSPINHCKQSTSFNSIHCYILLVQPFEIFNNILLLILIIQLGFQIKLNYFMNDELKDGF